MASQSPTRKMNYHNLNGKAIEKYLVKQNTARNMKQEQKEYEQRVFSQGQNWTPEVTKPQLPNLSDATKIEQLGKDKQAVAAKKTTQLVQSKV